MTKRKQLTFKDLRNKSEYDFFDVTSEDFRNYHMKDGSLIIIENPVAVAVSKSGHRVLDGNGLCHFIPATDWNRISWKPKAGQPHFVK